MAVPSHKRVGQDGLRPVVRSQYLARSSELPWQPRRLVAVCPRAPLQGLSRVQPTLGAPSVPSPLLVLETSGTSPVGSWPWEDILQVGGQHGKEMVHVQGGECHGRATQGLGIHGGS